MLISSYLINRLPTKSLPNRSPYEQLYQRKPTYSHLRSSGCLCFLTILKNPKDKFEPRATNHIFVGYPYNTKGYKVIDLSTKRIHVCRDVSFHEYVFPFVIAPASYSFNSILKLLVHHPNRFTCMLNKTNTLVNDEMLDTNTTMRLSMTK